MDTIEAIYGRRSIRDYAPRLMPRDLIDAILHDAAQAPTPPVSGTRLGVRADYTPHAAFTLGYPTSVPSAAPRTAQKVIWVE